MFKIPTKWLDKKRHVLRVSEVCKMTCFNFLSKGSFLIEYDTIITPGNENLVHHWTVNECGPKFEEEYVKQNRIPEPGPCFSFHPSQPKTNWSSLLQYCSKVSFVWAVGSPLVSLLDPYSKIIFNPF